MKVKLLMLVCLLMAVFVAVGCAPTKAPPKAEVPAGYERLRVLGGSLGGTGSTTAMVVATILNKYYPEIEWSSCSAQSSTSLIYITNGSEKLGTLVPGNYVAAYGFDKVPESRLRSIFLGTALSHILFLIPEDKPWQDITQVPKGVNFSPGPAGSSTIEAVETMVQIAGLGKKDFNWLPMVKGETADAWRTGKIDLVGNSLAGVEAWLVDMYNSPRRFKAMGMSPEQAAKAKAERTFERIGVEAPVMGNLSEIAPSLFKYDVVCPQFVNLVCCRYDFPDEIAYKMAKVLDEHKAERIQIFPAMKYGTPELHVRYGKPPYAIHPGVAKYYREKGYLK